MNLNLLSAGAAKGLVLALQEAFLAETGTRIVGTFGAVGVIEARLRGGEPCDVVVLTAAMIDRLAGEGRVLAATVAPLGRVRTGMAVRDGSPHPPIGDRAALRTSLAAASTLYCPDTERSTAGIHFLRVLEALGLRETIAGRLRSFPDGATAMRELAHSTDVAPLGCTQVTEILYTPGVRLVGPLPVEFELATVYSVAVTADSPHQPLAQSFAALLAGPATRVLREHGGFEA